MSKGLVQLWKVIHKTDPPKYKSLGDQRLELYEHYLSTKLPSLTDQQLIVVCRNRIELLRQEIQFRRIDEKAGHRHKQVLFWAIVAGVTGLLILIAEYVPLVRDTFFSKVQPSNAPQGTPNLLRQSQAPKSAATEPAASSSSATPSPEPTATAQPSLPTPEQS